ncbi:unnamed protein product [Paramecium sonneborni]|uniref:Uncharacterized protein n=1 Tax=Paramecium sonneborni TaxID=65129 RepID=A0A8S1PKJ8_9CILI|nr:unnamed protein product [Paramecium sonneborni]
MQDRDINMGDFNGQIGQGGSTQFNQFEIVSNQNSGLISMEINQQQIYYSDSTSINFSNYVCKQQNSQSQEFGKGNSQYLYGDCLNFVEVGVVSQKQINENLESQQSNQIPQQANETSQTNQVPQTQIVIPQKTNYTSQIDQKDMKLYERYYENEICPHLLPMKEYFLQTDDPNNKVQEYISNQQEVEISKEELQELYDAQSQEFKMKIAQFSENKLMQNLSFTQKIYGKQQKSIRINKIQDKIDQTLKLCQQFTNRRYSQIVLSFQLLDNFEDCQEFLQNLDLPQEKPILRKLNQLIGNEQKDIENGIINELQKSDQKIIDFFKNDRSLQIKDYSLNQILLKIIEENNYMYDIKKLDKQNQEKSKSSFAENRNKISEINNQKENLIQQYQTGQIDEKEFNKQLENKQIEKQELNKTGKRLFLELMIIENGSCQIDFHDYIISEIENILDDVFDKIEAYKISLKLQQIKLQIIIGEGLNSKNYEHIINPMIQHYIQQYLQQKIEIKEGKIDVIV